MPDIQTGRSICKYSEEYMVLPIDPSIYPLNPNGLPIVIPENFQKPNVGTLQSFPGLPPQENYVPRLSPPGRIDIMTYSKIVNNSIDRLKEMIYYAAIVNHAITKRFYQGNVVTAESATGSSAEIANQIFDTQVEDPNFKNFINQGVNVDTADMNNAITNFILGPDNNEIDAENQIVDNLNQAMQNFALLANPSPSDIAALNALLTSYNSYAATRNNDINSYNNAVDVYNNSVGIGTVNPDGSVTYPPGSVNAGIQAFNTKYQGTGTFAPLPFFQTLEHRDLLPVPLPLANPNPVLTTQLNGILVNPSPITVSAYNAFEALNNELNQSQLSAPDFGGNVTANAAINNYNLNAVPLEQAAVNSLNTAIAAFGNPNNPAYGNSALLNAAVSTYNSSVPALNNIINDFNTEAVGGFNTTIGSRLNSGIAAINSLLPTEIQYDQTILTPVPLMPAFSQSSVLLKAITPYPTIAQYEAPHIKGRGFHPVQLPDDFDIDDIPPGYDPILNPDGTISINQFLPVTDIPTDPPASVPDPYADINSFFTGLNSSIATYNTSVGDPTSPASGTENAAIATLNSAIATWNSQTTHSSQDLIDLQDAITFYINEAAILDDAINGVNAQVNIFNTDTSAPPAQNLANLNQQIGLNNLTRQYYNLEPIPTYGAKALRNLMPSAPVIPPGADPTTLSTFSLLPKRIDYSTVPQMTQVTVEAFYLFNQASAVNSSVENSIFTTLQQTQDPNFQGYQSLLEGAGSIPNVYDNVLNNYNTMTLPDPGGMPPIAISGGNVLLDPATQQAVTDDLTGAINQIPPLSQVALQQKIDQYNNYSALVNTEITNANAAIDNLRTNMVGVADPMTGNYPPGTLNAFAQSFNNTYGTTGLVGPLKILDSLQDITLMPTALPPAGSQVIIAGQPESLYGLGALLNAAIQSINPGAGNLSVNAINAIIANYNMQTGNPSSPAPETENGIIQGLNNALSNFNSDVASGNPATDPNLYFQAIDTLDILGTSVYDTNANILDNGGMLGLTSVTGINVLNGQISNFNTNSLGTINSGVSSLLTEINSALSPFSFLNFFPLASLQSRAQMPEAPDTSSPVPGEITPLLGDRTLYPSVGFNLTFPDRVATTPTSIPTYFSIVGNSSDLTNLNNNVYLPLIQAINAYNNSLAPGQGTAYENSILQQLNAAITSFNAGTSTSDDLKEAVSEYIQQISTDPGNVNGNINSLNTQIQNYRNLFAAANSSLTFWGLPVIPSNFNIPLRDAMQSAPLPIIASGNTYALSSYTPHQPQPLTNRTNQTYPTMLVPGSSGPTLQPEELSFSNIMTTTAEQNLFNGIISNRTGFANVRALLKKIEKFADFQDFLRGKRVEYSNSFREPQRIALYPSVSPGSVAAAAMAIGLTSHNFEALLLTDLFRNVMSRFQAAQSGNSPGLFQSLIFELLNKVSVASFTPSLYRIGADISFPSTSYNLGKFDNSPISPITALGFLEQLLQLVGSDTVSGEVGEALGSRTPGPIIDAVSAVLNVSLLSHGLVVVSNAFGSGVAGGILNQVSALGSNAFFKDNLLPKVILSDQILQARIHTDAINDGALRDAILAAATEDQLIQAAELADDIIQQAIEDDEINDSIIQDDEIDDEDLQDEIDDDLTDADTESDLTAQALMDDLEQRALDFDIQNARTLAYQTTAELVSRNYLMSELNRSEVEHQLIQNQVIEDNAEQDELNNFLLISFLENFDRIQISENSRRDALASALQNTFNLTPSVAGSVANSITINTPTITASPLDIPGVNTDESAFRNALWDRIEQNIEQYDINRRAIVQDELKKIILDGDHSLRNLLNRNISRINELNDEKISRQLADELRERFSSVTEPSVFLARLQDPLYFGIYSPSSGPMYEGIRKNDLHHGQSGLEIQV